MWTDTQEYSTSLGKVLIQVCERSGDEPAPRAAREAQDHSDDRRAKPVTKSSNIKGQSVSVEDSDNEIEEIEGPVAALPSANNPLNIHYPDPNTRERKAYKTPGGKTVPQHHWDVYDFTRTIPKGKVVTYKDVTVALRSGSPRSVGGALRNNPFAPYIPCHRVIASNLFAGGFCGEWGPESKSGTQYHRKLNLLKEEGVKFNDKGKLADTKALWDRKSEA